MKIKVHIAMLDSQLLVAPEDSPFISGIKSFSNVSDLIDYVEFTAKYGITCNFEHAIVEVDL